MYGLLPLGKNLRKGAAVRRLAKGRGNSTCKREALRQLVPAAEILFSVSTPLPLKFCDSAVSTVKKN